MGSRASPGPGVLRARRCDRAGDPAHRGPAVHEASGSWWRRWVLQHQAARLWHLAYGSSSARVSSREFARLLHWSRRVKAALADGTLRLQEPT